MGSPGRARKPSYSEVKDTLDRKCKLVLDPTNLFELGVVVGADIPGNKEVVKTMLSNLISFIYLFDQVELMPEYNYPQELKLNPAIRSKALVLKALLQGIVEGHEIKKALKTKEKKTEKSRRRKSR